MTRRDRLERKLDKREAWASGAQAQSAASFERAGKMAEAIPFGQPVLVGHHSEKRDRRYRGRIHSAMDRGVELSRKAEHHESKARGLATQLERSIFDDDPDAVERLEARAAESDRMAEQCNAINRVWRSGGHAAVLAQFGQKLADACQRHASMFACVASKPMSATSDRASARKDRERIRLIQKRRELAAQAAATESGVMITGSDSWVNVRFADKPERSVIDALKAAGFRWGGGAWMGYRSKLPQCVQALEQGLEQGRGAA